MAQSIPGAVGALSVSMAAAAFSPVADVFDFYEALQELEKVAASEDSLAAVNLPFELISQHLLLEVDDLLVQFAFSWTCRSLRKMKIGLGTKMTIAEASFLAARRGYKEFVEFFLNPGTKPHRLLLDYAIIGGNLALTKSLAERFEFKSWSLKHTALAAFGGHIEIFRWLVKEKMCPYDHFGIVFARLNKHASYLSHFRLESPGPSLAENNNDKAEFIVSTLNAIGAPTSMSDHWNQQFTKRAVSLHVLIPWAFEAARGTPHSVTLPLASALIKFAVGNNWDSAAYLLRQIDLTVDSPNHFAHTTQFTDLIRMISVYSPLPYFKLLLGDSLNIERALFDIFDTVTEEVEASGNTIVAFKDLQRKCHRNLITPTSIYWVSTATNDLVKAKRYSCVEFLIRDAHARSKAFPGLLQRYSASDILQYSWKAGEMELLSCLIELQAITLAHFEKLNIESLPGEKVDFVSLKKILDFYATLSHEKSSENHLAKSLTIHAAKKGILRLLSFLLTEYVQTYPDVDIIAVINNRQSAVVRMLVDEFHYKMSTAEIQRFLSIDSIENMEWLESRKLLAWEPSYYKVFATHSCWNCFEWALKKDYPINMAILVPGVFTCPNVNIFEILVSKNILEWTPETMKWVLISLGRKVAAWAIGKDLPFDLNEVLKMARDLRSPDIFYALDKKGVYKWDRSLSPMFYKTTSGSYTIEDSISSALELGLELERAPLVNWAARHGTLRVRKMLWEKNYITLDNFFKHIFGDVEAMGKFFLDASPSEKKDILKKSFQVGNTFQIALLFKLVSIAYTQKKALNDEWLESFLAELKLDFQFQDEALNLLKSMVKFEAKVILPVADYFMDPSDFHDLAKMVAKFVHFLIQDNRSVKLVDAEKILNELYPQLEDGSNATSMMSSLSRAPMVEYIRLDKDGAILRDVDDERMRANSFTFSRGARRNYGFDYDSEAEEEEEAEDEDEMDEADIAPNKRAPTFLAFDFPTEIASPTPPKVEEASLFSIDFAAASSSSSSKKVKKSVAPAPSVSTPQSEASPFKFTMESGGASSSPFAPTLSFRTTPSTPSSATSSPFKFTMGASTESPSSPAFSSFSSSSSSPFKFSMDPSPSPSTTAPSSSSSSVGFSFSFNFDEKK